MLSSCLLVPSITNEFTCYLISAGNFFSLLKKMEAESVPNSVKKMTFDLRPLHIILAQVRCESISDAAFFMAVKW